MTMLYPNLCYNKVCYKGTALYCFITLCYIIEPRIMIYVICDSTLAWKAIFKRFQVPLSTQDDNWPMCVSWKLQLFQEDNYIFTGKLKKNHLWVIQPLSCLHFLSRNFYLSIRSAAYTMYSDAHQINFITEAVTMNNNHSSLIFVHIVCNIGYQSTWAEVRADDNFCK